MNNNNNHSSLSGFAALTAACESELGAMQQQSQQPQPHHHVGLADAKMPPAAVSSSGSAPMETDEVETLQETPEMMEREKAQVAADIAKKADRKKAKKEERRARFKAKRQARGKR